MPTGYTAGVQDGKISTLEQFAFTCARAFGALIAMREYPSGTPIPERFEPSDHNAKALTEAQGRINDLPTMSAAECEAAAGAEYQTTLASHLQYEQKRRDSERRYRDMREKVQCWKPDPMLSGLRDFMLEQLESSLSFDCDKRYQPKPPIRLTGENWRAEKLADASRDLAYHSKAHQEEVERVEGRNQWLAALRASLPAEMAP